MIVVIQAVANTVGLMIVLAIVVKFWPRAGKWGLNLKHAACPRCQATMPTPRRPRNVRQLLWGGWTCATCGCEMDKYGVEVSELKV